jgi:Fe-S-cluster-containing dehydrogenase component/anaerobic selenocysteine-containing dehydrogenase
LPFPEEKHSTSSMDTKNHTRSLTEHPQSSALQETKDHEFSDGVMDTFDPESLPPISRKRFMALLAASAAFATSGCTNYRDKGEIVPYTRKPEEITPGIANLYASTCTGCAQRCGILVKTREGRPIKLDGNPDHPVNLGRLCAKGQASILDLYDPERLRAPQYGLVSGKSGALTWASAHEEIRKHLADFTSQGKSIILVTHPALSPTQENLLRRFAETYRGTRILRYDLLNDENRRGSWERSYGPGSGIPSIAWDRAAVILALESDILGTEGSTIEQTRMFAAGRDVMRSSSFSRLYVVEGGLSLTGANADYRLRLRPDMQIEFVLALIHEIGVVRRQGKIDGSVVQSLGQRTLAKFAKTVGLPAGTLEHLVDDLCSAKGASIVHAGSSLPASVHSAVNYLNEMLGNTALYGSSVLASAISTPEEVREAVAAMKAGTVGVVVHVDTNPVFHMPATLGYEVALKNVPVTVSLTEKENETSALCGYVLPINSTLESWGDWHVRAGIYSLQQPVVAPLFDTWQKESVLLAWMRADAQVPETVYHAFLMEHWQKEIVPLLNRAVDFNTFWNGALHDGVVLAPAEISVSKREFHRDALEIGPDTVVPRDFCLSLTEGFFTGDGRFAGNGWLQELPHPVTKVVWDNYAALAPSTASKLGIEAGDMVEVGSNAAKQIFPAFVQPGMAENTITIALGYGRRVAGPVGTHIGVDASALLGNEGLFGVRVISGASASKSPGRYDLASTQEHHSLDDSFVKDFHRSRGIIREGTVDQYRRDPHFMKHHKKELFSISKEVTYDGVKWAMAIDLNKCTACNACVSSCNVENNIPVVGKEQVAKGREMQWIRIDRYFSGTPEAPIPSHQPMLCQHCDHAPCENVCPVVATTHSPDGLNQMVYNRCVGTKYCSNNCPYKVRRFNFFNFRDHFADGFYQRDPVSLVHNPEVTVRSRGVMEKCTFCVQRIVDARQHAVEQGREFTGVGVETACQQACPAQAIVFGDMNNKESTIAGYRAHELGYSVLEELNVRPNVTYLARLRNTHPEDVT